MYILALIPARGGSKGITKKNIRKVEGKPLIAFPIQTALRSQFIDRVIVSTDNREIADIARQYGAEVPFIRPAEYATDDATDLGVFSHCLNWIKVHEGRLPDLVVQLRATAPIRSVEYVDEAIELIMNKPDASSLRSVSAPPFSPYKMWYKENDKLLPLLSLKDVKDWYDMPRQKLPKVYAQDGFIDIIRTSTILDDDSMAGEHILGYETKDETVDIDDIDNLNRASQLIREYYSDLSSRVMMDTVDIGIIQGRLTPSQSGKLQEFPEGLWEHEFYKAADLGLQYIELIIDQENKDYNPLCSTNGLYRLKKLMVETEVSIRSVCIDAVINKSLLEDQSHVDYIFPHAASLGVNKVILPLFGQSELNSSNLNSYKLILQNIADIAESFQIEICLETILPGRELESFVKSINTSNIKVCYDTGNCTFYKHDIVNDIKILNSMISHVHIKDRTFSGENVSLGSGDTNLSGAVKALYCIGYKGSFTLENTRGEDPLISASNNKFWLKQLVQDHYDENKRGLVSTV